MRNNIYKDYALTNIQENILIGSVLGDGNLALYGRSKNAHYREHGCKKQLPYREWKCAMLRELDFKILYNEELPTLISPSHPIYTKLYNLFYKNNKKTITKENIKLLNHPIGLATLFMDDGSLIIDSSLKYNKLYLFPRVSIYTQSFSEEENALLIEHVKELFDVEFKIKHCPYGKKNHLEINKRNEIDKFLKLIYPYVSTLPCMKYKADLETLIKIKYDKSKVTYFNFPIIISPSKIISNTYTKEDEKLIINLKNNHVKDKDIATALDKSYYGVVDKIRRMRKEGKLLS